MVKKRIPERDHGITGEEEVSEYDRFQKYLRDKGILETDNIIKHGISYGTALEIGPGPGYLGLEWLKKTKNTKLTGLEISEDMKKFALENAEEYGMENRVEYVIADATRSFPFESSTFDAVFSYGSLHEWTDPIPVFNEIARVLKARGRFFISDLKRNINFIMKSLMNMMTKSAGIVILRDGVITSINASYLKKEILEILKKSDLNNFSVSEHSAGLRIKGTKD
jgi:ubiquinone/menaquinone biosynthesis C-methylase UbiE